MDTANNRPLKSHEWVMNDIKRRIQAGELAAGSKLSSVTELAAFYGVGQSTIREALSVLKALKMLTIRQGSGTYVNAASEYEAAAQPAFLNDDAWTVRAHTLRHILEVRKMLETGCAALAAQSRSEADLQALSATLVQMRQALGDETLSEQADVRFHQQLAEATHNPILASLMESLSQQLHDSMKDTRALWFYSQRSSAERLLGEHEAIYKAVAARSASEAAQMMEEHLSKVETVLYDKLDSQR
jgi:GntR family transcriptional repressor for pyruvate dehydrogenase complex